MKVVFGIGRIKKNRRSVVALGVFDGLHLGHLRILKETVRYAKQIKGKSVVITFSPHPQRQLYLYSLGHRLRLFRKIGVDLCVIIRFTDSFSKVSAAKFIKNFLVSRIHPECIIIGENFTFGKDARGNALLLKQYADIYNFRLKIIRTYKLEGKAISSTGIRHLILTGKLDKAARQLGRPVSILGTVVKGGRIARYLGFPTANIEAHHEVLPPSGVYTVAVNLSNKKYKGTCYIGTKPTLKQHTQSKPKRVHIEVHIFGFNKNIYGKDLEVLFMKKIRAEKKFTSLKLLAEQVKRDINLTKSYFRSLQY
jgi:riboflavin kinase/FMN adenylyltransferase